jgi:hypothetical protein
MCLKIGKFSEYCSFNAELLWQVEQQATQFLEEKRALREELETVRTTVVDTHQELKDDTVDNSKEIQEVSP